MRTEVGLIGVYLVIFGVELFPDLEELPLRPLDPPLPPPLPLAASDNSTITRVMEITRNTVAILIFADDKETSMLLLPWLYAM